MCAMISSGTEAIGDDLPNGEISCNSLRRNAPTHP